MSATIRTLAMSLSLIVGASRALAVITFGSGDPTNNATAPTGDLTDSGWQHVGQLFGPYSGSYPYAGVLVSSNCVLGAKHLNYGVGSTFILNGVTATVVSIADHPSTGVDARIFRLDRDFPVFAPLYTGDDETGKQFVVFGNGTRRGSEVVRTTVTTNVYTTNIPISVITGSKRMARKWIAEIVQDEYPGAFIDWRQRVVTTTVHELVMNHHPRGWRFGANDQTTRWGVNTFGGVIAPYLYARFDNNGDPNECTVSFGDSSGPCFARNSDGQWCLAAIAYGIQGPYRFVSSETEPAFYGAIYDKRGLYEGRDANSDGYWSFDLPNPVPSNFFLTGVSSIADWIIAEISGGTAAGTAARAVAPEHDFSPEDFGIIPLLAK